MKAVILKICPTAKIIDITHNVSKFNISMGAFILASASTYFPTNTIHVAVVDPGVGVSRRPLLIETNDSFFIGPDNGLLVLAAERQGIKRIYTLKNNSLMLNKVSNTFHGRDIFAPAAAHLLNGIKPLLFGPQISKLKKPFFTKITRNQKSISGEAIYIDGFGNIITNIPSTELNQNLYGKLTTVESPNSKFVVEFCRSYSDITVGELLVLIGSHGYLEISVNQGNAAVMTKIQIGDKIVITVP
jgi:S-adenosylmethionine hydrolase